MRRGPTQAYPPMGFESGMFGSFDYEEDRTARTVRSVRIDLMRNLSLRLTLARHDVILNEIE